MLRSVTPSRDNRFEIGTRVVTHWRHGTIAEEVHSTNIAAPPVQYNIDIGGGWLTRIWPQDVIGIEE